MKVAYLMGSLNRGGAETLVLDICKNAGKRDFEILLIHRKNGQLREDFLNSGVALHQIYPKRFFDIFYFLRLRRIIIKNNILIIHSHQVIDAWFAYLATLFLPSKVVLSFHGHGVNSSPTSKLFRRLILIKSDLNIFVSEYQKKYYEKVYNYLGKNVVIPNGIDFNKFCIPNNKSIRTELGLNNTDLLIGSVGNFTSGRDHFTLCKFISLLKKANIEFKFIFVGAESKVEPWVYQQCFDYCQKQGLDNNVIFLGTRSDVPAILSQLDAFIYSTEHDTFGIAVVEAMAMGLPVFVNDWDVMKEITNNGQWATLYQSKNPEDLLDKFSDFISNISKFKTNALLNALSIKKEYSIEAHLTKLAKIYQTVLKK